MKPACLFERDWDLYLLGAIESDRASAMESHLADGCEACETQLSLASQTIGLLSIAPTEIQPSTEVADRLRKRIASETAPLTPFKQRTQLKPAAQVKPDSVADKQPAQNRNLWPWLAAAASLAIAGYFGWERHQWQQQAERLANQQLRAPMEQRVAPKIIEPAPPATTPLSSIPVAVANDSAATKSPADKKELLEMRRKLELLTQEKDQLQSSISDLRQEFGRKVDELKSKDSDNAQLRLAANAGQEKLRQLESELQAAKSTPKLLAGGDSKADPQQLVALQAALDRATKDLEHQKKQSSDVRMVMRLLDSPNLRQITLASVDGAAGRSSARALYAPEAGVLVLARDLPKVAADKCLQLWLVNKGPNPIASGGLLRLDTSGHGIVFAPPSANTNSLTALAITDEPAGGSNLSRGRKLLFGSI
jgi:anti-sigma-K factor RskA